MRDKGTTTSTTPAYASHHTRAKHRKAFCQKIAENTKSPTGCKIDDDLSAASLQPDLVESGRNGGIWA